MSERVVVGLKWDGKSDHEPRNGQFWENFQGHLVGPSTGPMKIGDRRCFDIEYAPDPTAAGESSAAMLRVGSEIDQIEKRLALLENDKLKDGQDLRNFVLGELFKWQGTVQDVKEKQAKLESNLVILGRAVLHQAARIDDLLRSTGADPVAEQPVPAKPAGRTYGQEVAEKMIFEDSVIGSNPPRFAVFVGGDLNTGRWICALDNATSAEDLALDLRRYIAITLDRAVTHGKGLGTPAWTDEQIRDAWRQHDQGAMDSAQAFARMLMRGPQEPSHA